MHARKNVCLVRASVRRRRSRLLRDRRFSRVSLLITCTGTRLNAERWRSFLAILLTDLASMLSSFAISRLLLLVPGLPSCEQIISSTAAMFSSVRAVLGFSLPGFRFTEEPVL